MHTSKKTQQTHLVIAGLLTLGSVVLFAGLTILVSQFFLPASQDLRRQALVPNGVSELSLVPGSGNLDVGKQQQIALKLDTKSSKIYGVQLKFNLVTQGTIGSLDAAFNQASGLNELYSKVEKTSDGYLVTFAGVPKTLSSSAYYSTTEPTTLLTLSFTPTKEGQITLNFDTEDTKTKSFEQTSVDQLKTIGQTTYNVRQPSAPPTNTTPTPTATPTTTTSATTSSTGDHDLYFAALTEERMKFYFYEKGSSTQVSDAQLTPGKWYTVKHTTYVLSTRKSSTQDLKTVATRLAINGNAVTTKNNAYSDFTAAEKGLAIPFELDFVAENVNKITLTADAANAVSEKAEDNNTLVAEFRYQTTASACNATCGSNADCPSNYRCYATGTDKRCRLVTNVSSTSCSTTISQDITRKCNDYCADTSECATGYSCWYNRCRNPRNLDSKSCSNPSTHTATTTVYTQAGCNAGCTTSRDCQAGLRCVAKSCRHPLNTSDASCSPYTNSGALSGSKGEEKALPSTTPKPAATAKPGTSAGNGTATSSGAVSSPKPGTSGNPQATLWPTSSDIPVGQDTSLTSPLPTPAATETAYDFLHILFGYSFAQIAAMNLWGVPVSTIAIASGVFLLLIILALVVALGRRRRYVPPVLSTPHIQGNNVVESQPVPPKTVVIPPSEAQKPTAPIAATPLATELPRQSAPPQPVTAPLHVQQAVRPQAPAQPQGSMVDRLRQKGVTMTPQQGTK